MNLNKNHWNKQSLNDFQEYLASLANLDKVDWTKKIINTNYPVLAIKAPVIKSIANEISKGAYFEFLEANLHAYYENFSINGELISKIKEFDIFKSYLLKYSKLIDNWASCDILKFNVNKTNEEKFLNLSKEMIKSELTFERRIGIDILFKFVNEKHIDEVFKIMNLFQNETEYYVNMALAWLLCECFIKLPNKTKQFLKENSLNNFVVNKGISKCRDSFRLSDEDKAWLLQFRR